MQHTLAAVYDNYSQAQHALDDLVASGFSQQDVHLSQSEDEESGEQPKAAGKQDDESFGAGVRSFFHELFGPTNNVNDAEMYSQAVRHGNYVLTVNVPDDEHVDEVTNVLDRYEPLDIDERSSEWRSGAWAASESMSVNEDSSARSAARDERQTQAAIPVIQEEVNIGKREVQRGGVRIYQRVVEQPVQENVELREEHIHVERRPVDQPAGTADLSALKEGSFEVRETAEEPVIEKSARVVEEVVVGKDVKQRTEQVSDTVRRTEVEIEDLAGRSDVSEDTYFRNHWNSAYAQSGGQYEEYEPAYRYGSTLANDDQYRDLRWSDMESTVRSDWESRYPGSAWERFKGAIRHGWERVTT